MMKRTRQIGALLLSAALLITQLGATAYAEGPPNTGGLCEHHTAHDDACGYVEAIPGHPCEHLKGKHTPECYTDELICGITEGDAQTASGSNAGHRHGQECYKLDCPHERGEHKVNAAACGYIAAVEGKPCGYVCAECGKEPDKDSGIISDTNPPASVENAPETAEPEDAGTIRITAFDQLGGGVKVQTVPKGTELESLNLPDTLGASGYKVNAAEGGREGPLGGKVNAAEGGREGGLGHKVTADAEPVPEEITITGVTWELTGENNSPTVYEDGRETSCSYYFQPVLPEGYTLDKNVKLPKIEVRYGWGTRANTIKYNDDDVAAFLAILKAHPELESIPGVDENDPASWQTAKLVTWNATTKRLTELYLADKGLKGTLNVSGLPELEILNCYENPDLTGLTLGTHNQLNYLQCQETGISGTLDVSDCPKLELLYCYENPNLTGLTLVTHTQLKSLNCQKTRISGTLDVSECPKLQTLNCYENPDLTGLTLGTHAQLGFLNFYKTGISGTLDVSNCPNLQILSCYDPPT